MARRAHIDLWLALLETIRPRSLALTQTELAEYIGCSRTVIHDAEHKAVAKLRRKAARMERGLR